jgi:4-hydroxy-4-methyl-2-oxoglutarate aldolase
MQSIDLPVYSRAIHPVAGTIQQVGAIQVPVTCGGVVVHPGDIVFADADGVVCGTEAELSALVDGATNVLANEEKAFAAFKAGTGLMDMLNFEEHYAARAAGKPSDLKYVL